MSSSTLQQILLLLLDSHEKQESFLRAASRSGQPWPLNERHDSLSTLLTFSMLFWGACLPYMHVLSWLLSRTYRSYGTWEKRISWLSYCLSLVHSPISVALSFYCLFNFDWPSSGPDPSLIYFVREPLIVVAPLFTLGYLIIDLILIVTCTQEFRDPGLLVVHHLLVGICSATALLSQQMFGLWFVLAFQAQELSTPFVAVRWFLLETGMKNSLLFWINIVVFAILATAGRVLWGNYVAYFYLTSAPPSFLFSSIGITVFTVAAVFFQSLQCFWLIKIAKLELRQRSSSSKESID